MSSLLSLSRLIDKLNEFVGRWVAWLVLAAVLISAVNASVRKAFGTSSNAFLEIQWYLFAGVFLLAAGYTLLRQEHVKIDVIIGRFTKRTQIKVEIFGLLGLQGVSELIKRFAFLKGLIADPTKKKQVKTAEEELAESILAQRQGAAK